MNLKPTDQETETTKSILDGFSHYHDYIATIEPFEAQAKRLQGHECPLSDEDYYKAVAAKLAAAEKLVIHLWNLPEINTNRALINFCRSLQYEIQHHVNEATA